MSVYDCGFSISAGGVEDEDVMQAEIDGWDIGIYWFKGKFMLPMTGAPMRMLLRLRVLWLEK